MFGGDKYKIFALCRGRYEQSTKSEIAAQEEQLETAKKRLNKNQETKARAEGEIETVRP